MRDKYFIKNIYANTSKFTLSRHLSKIFSVHIIAVLRIMTSYPAVKFRHWSQRHVLYVYNETGDAESITPGKCVSPK